VSALSPAGLPPAPQGHEPTALADSGSGPPVTNDPAATSEPGPDVPAHTAALTVRLRRLEAELRAERRHATTAQQRLAQVQADLQQALEQLEERHVAAVELQTILQATEPRLVALVEALAERERFHTQAIDEWAARHAALRSQLGAAETRYRQLAHDVASRQAQPSCTADEGHQPQPADARVGQDNEQPALRLVAAHVERAAGAQHDRSLATVAAPSPPPSGPPQPDAPPAMAGECGEREGLVIAATAGPLTVVNIDDQPSGRDAVRAAVNRQPGTHYVCPQFPPAGTIRSATLLAVNLLCRHLDPLAVIADARKWGVPEARAFTYCCDGNRTIVLGLIEYFPFPFDPDACAARLFARPEGTRRILTVSNHIELMTRLRKVFGDRRCATTVALDGRQALDLVKPVNPALILIDLALPRGEGLELLNRLHAEAATAAIPVALLWTQKLASGIFRQYAGRILQDWRGDGTGVTPALAKLLVPQPGLDTPAEESGSHA
jgi:CheY-like chemotaxis protein